MWQHPDWGSLQQLEFSELVGSLFSFSLGLSVSSASQLTTLSPIINLSSTASVKFFNPSELHKNKNKIRNYYNCNAYRLEFCEN